MLLGLGVKNYHGGIFGTHGVNFILTKDIIFIKTSQKYRLIDSTIQAEEFGENPWQVHADHWMDNHRHRFRFRHTFGNNLLHRHNFQGFRREDGMA